MDEQIKKGDLCQTDCFPLPHYAVVLELATARQLRRQPGGDQALQEIRAIGMRIDRFFHEAGALPLLDALRGKPEGDTVAKVFVSGTARWLPIRWLRRA